MSACSSSTRRRATRDSRERLPLRRGRFHRRRVERVLLLLVDKPEVYHLPAQASLPSKRFPRHRRSASAAPSAWPPSARSPSASAAWTISPRPRGTSGVGRRGVGRSQSLREITSPSEAPRHPSGEGGRAMTDLLLQVAPPSNTWFTDSPEWGGTSSSTSSWAASPAAPPLPLRSARSPRRPPRPRMTRIGYLIALVAIIIGGPLLIIDLMVGALRYMVWMSDAGGPMFKPYSAISLGIWIILLFVIFVVLAVIASFRGVGSRSRKSEVLTIVRLTTYTHDCLGQDRCPRLHPHRLGAGGVHRARPDRHQPAALGRHRLDHPPLPPLRHLGGGARR